MNLLEIVQTACAELGLDQPETVAGATDLQTKQLMALVNRDGDNLFRAKQDGWVQLQQQHIVNIETPIITTGDIAAGSAIIANIPSTAGIVANQWAVSGNTIPIAARVIEVIDATTVRMDEPASTTEIGTGLTFAKDTYAIPPDFSWFINRTMWDRTNRWELIGPISPQMDQWQRSGVVTTGPRRRWRQVGLPLTNWRLWPPPTATGDYPATLVFEYVSAYWVIADDGTRKPRFTADTDTPLIDEQAFILGVKWRMWQIKGFSYQAFQQEYIDYVAQLIGRNGGAPDLSLSPRPLRTILLGPFNVVDGYFPGP